MKKILVPVDASEYSKKAIEEAKVMARAFDSEIVLLYVVSMKVSTYWYNPTIPEPEIMFSILDDEREHAEKLLQDYKDKFDEIKDRVEKIILEGPVSDEIVDYANNSDIDFVIIGSHGIGSTVRRSLLGSIANKVVHYVEKPILIVR